MLGAVVACVIKEKIKTKNKMPFGTVRHRHQLTPCHVCYFSGARIKYCDLRKEEFTIPEGESLVSGKTWQW